VTSRTVFSRNFLCRSFIFIVWQIKTQFKLLLIPLPFTYHVACLAENTKHELVPVSADIILLVHFSFFAVGSFRTQSRRKTLITFALSFHPSFCLSVRQHLTIREPANGFSWNLILGMFPEICWYTPNVVEIGQQQRSLYIKSVSQPAYSTWWVSGPHLNIPHTGMEPAGKRRHPIGSSYSV
jgi:hypothetical protein